MKKITSIDTKKLGEGIREILKDMAKGGKEPSYPIPLFEQLIIDQHGVSKKEAERVTEAVINSGYVAWEMFGNNFVLNSVE